ncbi:choice-of-anchor D domain-containing protein [Myxococcota bacterium]|nr:choice-of-anchor D domain-containing protein [Myxococcota bacterium]
MLCRVRLLFFVGVFLFLGFWGDILSGCQCGVSLRTDPEIGPRQLKTDLPDRVLRFEQGKRFIQTRPFLLYNDGTQPLNVISFGIVDDPEGIYAILQSPSSQKPFTLAPGIQHAVSFSVRFRARRPGVYNARMRFFAPSADNTDEDGYFYVPMPAEREKFGPLFDCGDALDFGEVPLGQSKELTCEVKNAGTAPLLLNGFSYKRKEGNAPSDFAWLSPELPLRIPPDGSGVTIRIRYKPSDASPDIDEGIYILETNLPAESDEEKAQIAVRGKTIAPDIALIPQYPPCTQTLDCQLLDERLDCSKTERKTFLVRNTGNAPLRVTGMVWTSESSPDLGLALPFAPFVVAPNQERPVEVLYKPSDNLKDKGQLVVLSDAFEKPEARLDVEAAAIGCKLAVAPTLIEFTQAESRPIALRNEGDEPCQIKSVSLRFRQTQVFALQDIPSTRDLIFPNASRTMRVQHTIDPKATPDIADILSNDFDKPAQEVVLIPVIPRPEKCAMIANPTTLNFQIVQSGQDKILTATFFNIGRSPCRVIGAKTEGTVPSKHTAFTLPQPPSLPLEVPVGQVLSLPVRYAPTQSSNYEGLLRLDTPEGEAAFVQVVLRGAFGSPCLEVVPRLVDFGPSRFTCAARDQKVHVYHVGATGCPSRITLQKVQLGGQTTQAFRIKSTSPPIPPSGFPLTVGQSIEISLGYRPEHVGLDRDFLEIVHSFTPQSPMSVPLEGSGVSEDTQTDTFRQKDQPSVDILFVVDNSCSMRGEQQELAQNFVSFINWASRLNVDYHIGVTHTDMTGRSGTPGCLQQVEDDKKQKHHFITTKTSDPSGVFQKMANVGTRGSGSEQGLEAAYRALTQPVKDSPLCNHLFYRDDASLSLVFVSDEEDQSPKSYGFYLSFFQNLKGARNANLVRGSAVVGPPPNGCRTSGTSISARSAPRYWDLAAALRGEKASICSSDWATTLSRLGAISFGLLEQFFLSRSPEPLTLQVKVNGAIVPQDPNNGWVYDAASNSIVFASSTRPPQAARIDVTYKAICN